MQQTDFLPHKTILATVRRSLLLLVVISNPLFVAAQEPLDNPYATRYTKASHWTSQINWSQVTNVRTIDGLINKRNYIDSAKLHQVIDRLSAEGGGILFFPTGMYYLNFHVRLKSGVVLRGETPKGVVDATKEGFQPPTKFVFEKYKARTTKSGIPHNRFKTIYGDTTGVQNCGLVNLDINRATICFFVGGYREVLTLRGATYWSDFFHNNIIIFGIRQNNAAIPSPEIPTKEQIAKGKLSLRWPYPYIGNVNLTISENCVIANCRLNDSPTDDFDQPGYSDDMFADFSGEEARFSFTDHPAVCINAWKVTANGKTGDTGGPWNPYRVLPFSERHHHFEFLDSISENSLRFKGEKEVRDNFLAARIRHEKIASNLNSLVLENNLLVDDDSLDIKYFVDNTGRRSLFMSTPQYVLSHFKKQSVVYGKDTLRFQLHVPKTVPGRKKYPLIVYLHPEDLFGRDNQRQLAQFIPWLCSPENLEKYPCFIFAPQETVQEGGWIKTDDVTPTTTLVNTKKVLDELLKNRRIDTDQVFIIGLSRGGTAAWRTAAMYPDLFSSVVALDGMEWLLTENEVESLSRMGVWTAVPKNYGFFSLFLITRLNAIKLSQRGHKAIFKLTDGWNREEMIFDYTKDDSFLPWLFSQRKMQL